MKKSIFCGTIALSFLTFLGNPAVVRASEGSASPGTETLTICVEESTVNSYELQPVIERFQEEFPEIELKIQEIPTAHGEDVAVREAEVKQIETEIMRGEGPDLFILYVGTQAEYNGSVTLFSDLEKTVRAGVFADLGALIEADGTIDMGNYYSFVQPAGSVGDSFLLFPLSFYNSSVNVTTEESLELSGIDTELADSSAKAYADELDRCLTDYQKFDAADVYQISLSYGLLDYDTGEVRLGDEEKWYYERDKEFYEKYKNDDRWSESYDEKVKRQLQELMDKEIPLVKGNLSTMSGAINFAEYMAAEGLEAIFWMSPDEKGDCYAEIGSYAAINANSRNQSAAMEFLKLLVSKEMQAEGYYPCNYYLPVYKGEDVLRTTFQAHRDRDSVLSPLPREEMSEASMKSLMGQLERITTGRLMDSQIYYIPIDGENTFDNYYAEYLEGELTYEEFADVIKYGLEFYWEE